MKKIGEEMSIGSEDFGWIEKGSINLDLKSFFSYV
ncbi:unnamed protein product [Arabidopsis lyrata]|uniref:Uncharacterized protein n=1 Tax=Arabidopsis suecica TaxID=45249 RepID=A0A8T1ZWB0_ARASU|nr:hypothetical protein ISN44_As10g006040 [Arabidopsis suecica]KAG7653167.1 hypothetical protein ISN44_As01g004600 [Arabidopsis suecica]CAH8251243.1 unnamed protein product [Arabidopsis lyrata]